MRRRRRIDVADLEQLRLVPDIAGQQVHYAASVRADDTAFRLGITEVREWVKTSRVERTASDVRDAVDRLGLHATDWVDRFRGSEARNRRGLNNPEEWETVLRPQLVEAQRTLRSLRARRTLITGTMRLPTWFTAGVMFQETAGFTPAKIKDGQLWTLPTGHATPAAISLSRPLTDLPAGQDVALAVAISADLTADVRQHLASTGRDIPC